MKATQSPLAMQQTISATGWPWSRQQVARQTPASNIHGLTRKLWRTQQHVGKFPTELWGLHANHTPQAQVLIVPGNPGCAAFYHNFMQQLHTAFGGTADVLGVSHVGHDADDISQGAVWGLDCQVQHKVQLLQELMAPGRPPLVILAHSIGSYIMLQVCHRPNLVGKLLWLTEAVSHHDARVAAFLVWRNAESAEELLMHGQVCQDLPGCIRPGGLLTNYTPGHSPFLTNRKVSYHNIIV
jgi:hypothetical protein